MIAEVLVVAALLGLIGSSWLLWARVNVLEEEILRVEAESMGRDAHTASTVIGTYERVEKALETVILDLERAGQPDPSARRERADPIDTSARSERTA